MGGTEKSNRILGCSLLFLCIAWIWVFAAMPTKASDNEKVYGYTYTYTSKEALEQEIANKRNEGLLYAGLFNASIAEDNIITKDELSLKTNAIKEPQTNTTYVIKFVPEGVLGITAQVSGALIADENLDASAIRFVTAVDSLVYDKVAFSVTRMKEGQAHEMVKDENVTNLVYSKLYAVDATTASEDNLIEYYPADMHSEALFFKTYKLTGVPSSAYNEDFTVTPYWVTYDGIRVEGTSSIKTMNLGRSWYYVDETATNENALGTYNDPFMTIQKAAEHETELVPKLILKNDMAAAAQITLSKALTISSGDSEKTIAISRSNNFTDEIFKITNGEVKFENVVVGDASQESTVDALVAKKGKLSLSNGVINGTVNIDLQEISLQNTVVGNAIALADRDKYVAINDTDKKLMFGEDGIVVVASDAHVHCPCGDVARVEGACYESEHYEVLFEALTDADESKLSGKNRYLTEDVTWDATREQVNASTEINLCLNGHTLTKDCASERLIQLNVNNIAMNVCGCCEETESSEKGSIVGKSAENKGQSGLFWVGNTNEARENINLNLYSMKLDVSEWSMNGRSNGAGAGVILFEGCSLGTYDSELVPAKTVGENNYPTAQNANRGVLELDGSKWNNKEGLAGRVENGELHDLTDKEIETVISEKQIPVAARAYHTTTGDEGKKLMFAETGIEVVAADAHVHCPCGDCTLTEGSCAEAGHYEGEYHALAAGENINEGGNYYLSSDLLYTRGRQTTAGVTINLCLNGHTMEFGNKKQRIMQMQKSNDVMSISGRCGYSTGDTKGSIVKESNGAVAEHMGVFFLQNGASLNLYNMILDVENWIAPARGTNTETGTAILLQASNLCTYGSTLIPAKTIGEANYEWAHLANRGIMAYGGYTWKNPEGLTGTVENGEVHDLANVEVGTIISTKVIPEASQSYHKVINGDGKTLNFTDAGIIVGGTFDLTSVETGTTLSDIKVASVAREYCTFTNGDGKKLMFSEEGIKVVASDAHVHCPCGDTSLTGGTCADAGHYEVEYELLTESTTSLEGGKNYYLNSDLTTIAKGDITSTNLNLCLNGHELKFQRTDSNRFMMQRTSSIMEVSGKCGEGTNGSIVASSPSNGTLSNVGVFFVQQGASLSLYNMTLDVEDWVMTTRNAEAGAGVLNNASYLYTYGSTIVPAKTIGEANYTIANKANRGVIGQGKYTWDNPEGLIGTVPNGEVHDLKDIAVGTVMSEKAIPVVAREYHTSINSDGKKLMFTDAGIQVVADTAHVHCPCGDESRTEGPCYEAGHYEIEFTTMTEADLGNMNGKNLYLSDDITWYGKTDDRERIGDSKTVNLCLNGYTFTKKGNERIVQYTSGSSGTMSVSGKCENSGTRDNGCIVGVSSEDSGQVGLLWVQGKSTLNLYDMTVDVYSWSMAYRNIEETYGEQGHGNGAGILVQKGCTLGTYGSTIIPAKDFGANAVDVKDGYTWKYTNRGAFVYEGGTWNNPEGLDGHVDTGVEYYTADVYLADTTLFVPVWSGSRTTPATMLDFEEKWNTFFTPNGRLMSMAHRGDCNIYYPENSLEGIMSSIQAGVDMIELDMRKTKDGKIVLMHDETLTRTTNVNKVRAAGTVTLPESDNISEWNYEELKQLRLCKVSGTNTIQTDYLIPTLEDAIKVSAGKVFFHLDKKDTTIDWMNDVYPIIKENEAYRSWLPFNYSSNMSTVSALIEQIKLDSALEKVAYQCSVTTENVALQVANIQEYNLPFALRASDYVEDYDTAFADCFGKYRIHVNALSSPYDNLESWKALYEKGYNILHVNDYMSLVTYIEETCFTESIPTE